jgi:hypothetical protein
LSEVVEPPSEDVVRHRHEHAEGRVAVQDGLLLVQGALEGFFVGQA